MNWMNWKEMRTYMDSLKTEVQGVTCSNVSEKKASLHELREKLRDEQAEYALSSEKYHDLVNDLFKSLAQQNCLLPKKLDEILTFFDELVMHSMVVGNTAVIDTWGIDLLLNKSIKTTLGEPKGNFVAYFNEKARTGPAMAAKYFIHFAQEFDSKLMD